MSRHALPRSLCALVATGWLALGLGGCVTAVPAPVGRGAPAADPRAAWTRVLAQHVLDDGRIDFTAIRRDPGDLDAYVAWVAADGPVTSPARFPDRAARLAYYIDTYNALAMWQVVTSPRRPAQRARFFVLSGLLVDGRRRSLLALENGVIRPLGDPRVHFALNCMVRGCPRLPREPFDPRRLDAQLDREARRFLNDPRNVQADPPLQVVRLSSILKFYCEDFLAHAPSLLAYVNRYREEPVPEGYRVEFIPYDWTLAQR